MVLGKRGRQLRNCSHPMKRKKYVRRATPIRKTYGKGFQPGAPSDQMTPELKHWDTGSDLVAISNTNTTTNPAYDQIDSLNQMAAGDDGSQRNGLKIQIRKLSFRIKLEVDSNSDAAYANLIQDAHLFRVIIYVDVSPNGTAPAWTQVFDSSPPSQGQLYDYNFTPASDRFKVLVNDLVRVGPSQMIYDGTNYHAGGNMQFRSYNIKNLNMATWFSDTTNNLAAIQRNNIGVFIACDGVAASIPHLKYSFRSRVRYEDY